MLILNYDKAFSIMSKEIDELLKNISTLVNNKSFEQAKNLCDKVIELDENYTDAYLYRGKAKRFLAQNDKDIQSAEADLQKALELKRKQQT